MTLERPDTVDGISSSSRYSGKQFMIQFISIHFLNGVKVGKHISFILNMNSYDIISGVFFKLL